MTFTLEEQQERQRCLTGTDIGAILGLNPYFSPYDIWLQKKGLVEPGADNPNMYWGRLLEDTIDKAYCEKTGNRTRKIKFMKKGIFGGTPDRLISKKLGLEIKTADSRLAKYYGADGSDVIPKHYYLQCAWYMMLTKRSNWDVAVLIGGNDFRIYHLERNAALEQKLKAKAEQWWERYIIDNEQPPIINTPLSLNWLEQKYLNNNGEMAEATAEHIELAEQYALLRDKLGRLKQEEKDIESRLKLATGENDGIQSRDFRFTWKKIKDKTTTDYKLACEMANVSPTIINTCTTKIPGYRKIHFKHSFTHLGD